MASTNASEAEFLAAKEATGPEPISLFRILRGYRVDPLVRWTNIRREHGDVAHYRYGLFDTYFISSPEGVKRVLQDNVANYTKEHPCVHRTKWNTNSGASGTPVPEHVERPFRPCGTPIPGKWNAPWK